MYYLCSENKGTDQLRVYLFLAYAKSWFSHDAAHSGTHYGNINGSPRGRVGKVAVFQRS